MKKIILLSSLILMLIFTVKAQENQISLSIGVGGAHLSVKPVNGDKEDGLGVNIYFGVLYNFNKTIGIGLEINSNFAMIGRFIGADTKVSNINAFLARGKYSFGDSHVIPYLGVLAGLYEIRPGRITFQIPNFVVDLESKITLGFAPEVGIQFGHLQFSTSYHKLGIYKSEFLDPISGNPVSIESNYRMWQYNIGFIF
ncbi:MAG: outer membrane beta-barrel protein [Cyclobacteriaceae bacterium]|nr:outer membrane beta-barrel protein [Cyclobacteriaceae bacterium]MCK5466897.1 outer membrane beta-barrel protein [Cyclobacteriaceae bacterium]